MARARRGRGEGSIYQRKDGTWCASISAGYDSDGKRRRKIVYGETKKEVRDKLREEHQRGFRDTSKTTVGQFLKHWLENSVKPTLAATTYQRYEQLVRLYLEPQLGAMRLARVEPVHVQSLYATLEKDGVSARQRELSGVVLQKAFKSAVRLRLILFNPCADVEKHRPVKREMVVWDKSQVDAFLKAAQGDRFHALYALALGSGMREGELLGLQWSDIDFEAGTVVINRTLEEISGQFRLKEPKTAKSRRKIDLPQFSIEALHEHRKAMLAEGHAAGAVFCDSQGGYVRISNLHRRSFKPIIKAAEVPEIRFHDLRHTHATLLLLAGENPKVVSERLGHADVTITLGTYSHVLPGMQKEAAARLDRLFA